MKSFGLTFYSVQSIWLFSKRLPGLFLPVLNNELTARVQTCIFLFPLFKNRFFRTAKREQTHPAKPRIQTISQHTL